MSVYIKPCHGCPWREGCGHREVLRKRAAGLGARSISFDCPVLAEKLQPGVRITIEIPTVCEDGWSEYSRYSVGRKLVAATVISVRPDYSFGCIVDPGEIDPEEIPEDKDPNVLRFRRTQRHTRIRAIRDEPMMGFCSLGSLLRDGVCDLREGVCACRQFDPVGDGDVL